MRNTHEIPVTPEEEEQMDEIERRQAQQATQQQGNGRTGVPDRIFLVIGDDVPAGTPLRELAEVTWCANRVNDTDIEYVRAQPAAAIPIPVYSALEHVALTIAGHAGQDGDEFVRWLIDGGLVEMVLSHFGRPAAATVPADAQAIRDAALEEAAAAVEQHDRTGRSWVPDSLWGNITREAAGRIRALKGNSHGE